MSADDSLRLDDGRLQPEAGPSPQVKTQRVIVRMLFDPSFVAQVYEDPDGALVEEGIPASYRAQIVGHDRRLWGADTLRRRRALRILMEEFPSSSTLALLEWRSMASLEAFFSAPEFHAAVRDRGYLALAFRDWLMAACQAGRLTLEQTRAVLALEGAMALARRRWREGRRGRDPALTCPVAPDFDGWVLPSQVWCARVPAGTLSIVQHVERWSFEVGLTPALVLCTDAPTPEPLPALGADDTGFLIECDAEGQAQLSDLELPWLEVLEAARSPLGVEALRADQSAKVAEAQIKRAAALAEAGILVAVRADRTGRLQPRSEGAQ